jgi:Glycosyltransferase 61
MKKRKQASNFSVSTSNHEMELDSPSILERFKVCIQNETTCQVARINPCAWVGWIDRTVYVEQTFFITVTNNPIEAYTNLADLWCQNVEFPDLTPGIIRSQSILTWNGSTILQTLCSREYDASLYLFPTDNKSQEVLIIPNWGKEYAGPKNDWKNFNMGFFTSNQLCFWPPYIVGDFEIETQYLLPRPNQTLQHFEKVAVASGFIENLWHAAAMLNHMCSLQPQGDIYFIFQRQQEKLPTFVYAWSSAMGINASRILILNEPIAAKTVLTLNWKRPDWTCLHKRLHLTSFTSEEQMGLAVLYFRSHSGVSRDIPLHIHEKLVMQMSAELQLKVVTFTGGEDLDTVQKTFSKARLVVGPHGAGLVNAIFCKKNTPVIEFITQDVFRAHQMNGGSTFGLHWWPILVPSFGSERDILDSIATMKHAIHMSQKEAFPIAGEVMPDNR